MPDITYYRVVQLRTPKDEFMWTIVSREEHDDGLGVGICWADKSLAEDICELMEDAYEQGGDDERERARYA